ncbi:MAG TPA: type II secretion system F family protein [Vicinamibacterales bacterium]|nr:type II secretion system F family protein [Vicinamibacterales bacterium]
MVLAFFAFLAVAGTIVGGYAAVTYLPEMFASRRMSQRLLDVASGPDVPEGADAADIVKSQTSGPLPDVDRMIGKTAAGSWLTHLISQSGIGITPSAVLGSAVGAGVLAAFVTAMFARSGYAPVVAAIAGLAAPFVWLMNRRGARLRRFEEQFPEALDLMGRAIRAGHAFQTAMGMAADELSEPVGPEFKTTFDQQNFGLPVAEALHGLSERVPLLDVRFFVTAVMIQRDTGGNLAEILDNLAHVVRERFKIRRQVRVHTAHGRFTGYVLLALPAALGIALSFINPDHMNLLFREHMGQVMLVVAIVMQTIGYVWIRQVIKIEV